MWMGVLERKNQKSIRNTKLNRAVVDALAITGFVAAAAVAPQVVAALGFATSATLSSRYRYRVKNVLTRMIRKGYVEIDRERGKSRVRLTKKGRAFALLMKGGGVVPKRPRTWDGKWRIVMYDFYEPAKTLRARIRGLLRDVGFVPLQKSVWVYPYDCEDIIFILKQEFKLGHRLLYIIADQIENDATLRTRFSLQPARS
jgi:hypothetical protein